MIMTTERIVDMLENTGFPMAFGMQKEIAALSGILHKNEEIKSATICFNQSNNSTNFLVLTNQRILKMDMMLGQDKFCEEFSLLKVESISYQKGMLMGIIEIQCEDKQLKIKKIDKKTGEVFVERAKAEMTGIELANPFMRNIC